MSRTYLTLIGVTAFTTIGGIPFYSTPTPTRVSRHTVRLLADLEKTTSPVPCLTFLVYFRFCSLCLANLAIDR